MDKQQKTYFVSDVHLGVPNAPASRERERKLVQWLSAIEQDASEIYIVGDLFDFWFEYRTSIPKGFTRILGKLADLRDKGIPIYFFTGNHDLWMFGYFEEELSIPVYHQPIQKEIQGKKFFIGHGDGLGPGDKGYKMLKKIFRNRVCQWLFRWVHPDIGIAVANYWSKRSRYAQGGEAEAFLGEDKEWLAAYAKKKLETEYFDYFIFGHRHLPLDIEVNGNSRYINLGDWINHYTYAVFDGENMEIKSFSAD